MQMPPISVSAPRLLPGHWYLSDKGGKPFFWLADSWWYGMTKRMSLDVFARMARLRARQGFTVIQCVIGVPPEIDWQDENAGNSGGRPFLPNRELNPDYFAEVDQKVQILAREGLVPCIFGSWGHHIETVGPKPLLHLWLEIVRRYNKYPVVWCLTGEADLFPLPGYAGLSEKKSITYKLRSLPKIGGLVRFVQKTVGADGGKLLDRRLAAWSEIAMVVKMRSKEHLMTVHPHRQLQASELFGNPAWLDIDAIQSGHSWESLKFAVRAIRAARAQNKPLINLEPWYEGILGQFTAVAQRQAFWASFLSGVAGYSYGAHGLWQMATKADKYMDQWGESDWESASKFPGAGQLGKARKWLGQISWWDIVPDQSVVIPAWQPDHQNGAFAARIKDSQLLIYISAGTSRVKFVIRGLKRGVRYRVSEIDPATMAVSRKRWVSGPGFDFFHFGATDRLIFVTKSRTYSKI